MTTAKRQKATTDAGDKRAPALKLVSQADARRQKRVDGRPDLLIFRHACLQTRQRAPLAELVDAPDSKSGSERSAGSIPARGTIFPAHR